jgi:hypothetical protein
MTEGTLFIEFKKIDGNTITISVDQIAMIREPLGQKETSRIYFTKSDYKLDVNESIAGILGRLKKSALRFLETTDISDPTSPEKIAVNMSAIQGFEGVNVKETTLHLILGGNGPSASRYKIPMSDRQVDLSLRGAGANIIRAETQNHHSTHQFAAPSP